MGAAITEGTVLWKPTPEDAARSGIARYLDWLRDDRHLEFADYADLWEWSTTRLDEFWATLWDYFEVISHRPYTSVLAEPSMPGARWFPGAELNYAEHSLRRRDDHPAVIAADESGIRNRTSYAELYAQVRRAAAGLRSLGVGKGDRVAAFLPNVPEALVAFLATAAVGAIWSSCPPDFGIRSVVHRFSQIEPRVLIAVEGYRYGGREYDRRTVIAAIRDQLPTLEATIVLPVLDPNAPAPSGAVLWPDFLREDEPLRFEPVAFAHPLWIVYSSGTTALPKAIVHGHGGILLEHLKELTFHVDIGPGDRFFWYTSTGWMMWNFLIAGLLVGSTIVLYDGSPLHPDLTVLWKLAQDAGVTFFGTSPPFIQACAKQGIEPGRSFDVSRLRGVGSTGAPLPPEGFAWVYEHVGTRLMLGSVSGGTDLCTAFLGSCPLLPVRAGEIQCRQLGARIEAFDELGRSRIGEVGELVITAPMPSMPVFFWNDPGGDLYRSAYFDVYPGVWRHGDWIKVNLDGSSVVYGRSDSTLNRGGVRMGTSEFYRVIEEFPEVADSLVVDTGRLGREGRLLLFVVLTEAQELDDRLRARITAALREQLSPRHVPDEIHQIEQVPRTLNGKKLEVPVKRILAGVPIDEAARRDALVNPDSLEVFARLAPS